MPIQIARFHWKAPTSCVNVESENHSAWASVPIT